MKNRQRFNGLASLFVALALCAAAAGCRRAGGSSNGNAEEDEEVHVATISVATQVVELGAEEADEPGEEAGDEPDESVDGLEESVGELARPPGNSRPSAEPYLRGKVVVIGGAAAGRPYLDRRSMRRLGELAAEWPEEVQTVVLKDCAVRRLGFYRSRENPSREFPAFAVTCDVTIVDRAAGAAVYWKRFESKVKEETTADVMTNFVSMYAVWEEIDSFLKGLPRR